MSSDLRPTIIEMVRRAIEAVGGPTPPLTLREWILERWPDTNVNSINTHINSATVNSPSRRHYPENSRPRLTDEGHRYDLLYRPAAGEVEKYDPSKHGVWQLAIGEDDRITVQLTPGGSHESVLDSNVSESGASGGEAFAAESHLRDYLARHIEEIESGLQLYVDDGGRDGVEYPIPVGQIDILAVDESGGFVVIELKVGRGAHAVVGQILLYKNWVARHLAENTRVRGIIIAQHITDKIRYAIANDADVSAREYELTVSMKPVDSI